METNSVSRELKQTRTLMFSNGTSGYVAGTVINSNLTAKNDSFNFDVDGEIQASFRADLIEEKTEEEESLNQNTNFTFNQERIEEEGGLNYLTYLKENTDNTTYNGASDIKTSFDDNTRGLTDAGMAVVAVGAVVATIATAGAAGAPIAGSVAAGTASTTAVGVATVGVATASSLASTAALSGANTSMNVDGNFLNQAGDIGKQTAKDTTSKESLKNAAIAGATAAVTFGLTQGISELTNSANAANGINTANTNLTLGERFVNGLQNSAIQTVSSSVAQSTVNGDSFEEALKNSAKNLAINAVGEIAANEIGSLAHDTKIVNDYTGEVVGIIPAQIDKVTQLSLHAALGCGLAAAGGNDCAAGAAAGVAGEATSQSLRENTHLTKSQIIESSKMIGAITAASIAGPDDGDSVFAGSQIARNASENNDLAFRLEKGGRSVAGHMIGYFQTPEGQWVQYEQMADGNQQISTIGALLNFEYNQLIRTSDKAKDVYGNNAIIITEEYLKNDPNIVYISTTKDQDKLITQKVLEQIDTMSDVKYQLWTNNCAISFASACRAGGVDIPESISRPDNLFLELQKMYPNK